MKKLFIMTLLCVMSISVSAQEHLTFKGVSIDGHLSVFVEKLKTKDFKTVVVNSDSAMLKGNFGGNDCTIAVYATKTSKIVHTVCVEVSESDSWSTLKSTYNEYKSSLATKYGNGKSLEIFLSPYEAGDGYEMSALRLNKCVYMTKYTTLKGEIILTIGYLEGGKVVLYYIDKANNALSEAEEKRLINSDL